MLSHLLIFCIQVTHIVQCQQTVAWNNYVQEAAHHLFFFFFCQEHRNWNWAIPKFLRMTHDSAKVYHILFTYRTGGSDIYIVCYCLWIVLKKKSAVSCWLLLLCHKSVSHFLFSAAVFPTQTKLWVSKCSADTVPSIITRLINVWCCSYK